MARLGMNHRSQDGPTPVEMPGHVPTQGRREMLAGRKSAWTWSIWRWLCLLGQSHCVFVYFDDRESSALDQGLLGHEGTHSHA